MQNKYHDAAALRGKTITAISQISSDRIEIMTEDGNQYVMIHDQDCCESVSIDDICGDVSDLIGTPILQAEEPSTKDVPSCEQNPESFTWTFYRLATIKGQVVIKWYGSSNGYYSETAAFKRVETL